MLWSVPCTNKRVRDSKTRSPHSSKKLSIVSSPLRFQRSKLWPPKDGICSSSFSRLHRIIMHHYITRLWGAVTHEKVFEWDKSIIINMSHIHDLQKALYSHLPTIAAPHRRIAEVVLPQMIHDHASFHHVRLGALSHVISRVRSEVAVSVPTKSWCVCVGLEEAEPLPLPRKQIWGRYRRRISRSCALSALPVLDSVLYATVLCSVLVQIAQQIKPSTQFHSSLKYLN
jgi:hypothetical protein